MKSVLIYPFFSVRSSLHPWIQVLISLGLLSQIVRRLFLWLNEIIKLRTKKESIFKKPQEVIDLLRVRLFKSIYNTLKFGWSYWFPNKEIKEEKPEITNWIRIYKRDVYWSPCSWVIQDRYNNNIISCPHQFVSIIEAFWSVCEYLWDINIIAEHTSWNYKYISFIDDRLSDIKYINTFKKLIKKDFW